MVFFWINKYWPSKEEPLGQAGERVAEKFLRKKGFRLLHKNYKTPYGELDLVMRQNETIVFVEVKTRRSALKGEPHEAVHTEKQKRLTRQAFAYLKKFYSLNERARFDIVSIVWPLSEVPTINHFENAFEAQTS
ncbi:MAG: YraN family protein [Pirellulaceae bacterium]|nr:YraN family protein [Pirellulaceae bacterium]